MSDKINIELINQWEDVGPLQASWQAIENHPNSSFGLFSLLIRELSDVESPYILLITQDQQTKSILVGRLEKKKEKLGIGPIKLGTMTSRGIILMHGGILGQLDDSSVNQVADRLLDWNRNTDIDSVTLGILREDSPLLEACEQRTGNRRGTIVRRKTHRAISIPTEPGKFLERMKSKHRSEVRRMERRLKEGFNGDVRVELYRDIKDIGRIIEDVECVASKTYQRGIGVGVDPAEKQELKLMSAAKEGRLRAWILYTGDIPRAFRLGIVYGDIIFASGTGYDPEVAQFRVGTILLVKAIDDLSREGMTTYDLGLGDAEYKRRFADQSWIDVSLTVFAPTLKGTLLSWLLSSAEKSEQLLRDALAKANMEARARSMIRLAGRVRARQLNAKAPK